VPTVITQSKQGSKQANPQPKKSKGKGSVEASDAEGEDLLELMRKDWEGRHQGPRGGLQGQGPFVCTLTTGA